MLALLFCFSCENESVEQYVATPSPLQIPKLFADNIIPPIIPIDNPQTQEGITLGKKLFFDPILSGNNTQACADCHAPENAFSDSAKFSEGINGNLGSRNSMPLFNLAWNYDEKFFWDGNTFSLEHQAFVPVSDPNEMNSNWKDVQLKLQQDSEYPNLFKNAFGTSNIDSTLVAKAIAQFERTLISANSKFDQYLLGETELTSNELNGFNVFMDETKGDCFHCHGSDKNPLWTDNSFHNNGLDNTFTDLGLGAVTGDPADNGKFKSPSLRNLAFTAPYMHDGRFATLEEVINHYSEGLKTSATIDPLMKKINQGGVNLSDSDKADLKAFLLSLSDYDFIIH
ncbi:cytochrome-c peroxidase [Algibacter amylolyticus]|uniref:Cytochrome-c peroxidase n=1 Tax=Algibacter amylolyticus TaxID=1608400 RepID=A0A5M7B053_9FLAO|nr:cytochrome c peroxidase [Algibacter amylolyticus]KAA5820864.1 cytochrome-c peroxidase [Algibacter amylolyticus]MBB5269892.1 cytochrome c peroxidase [Algibacter amylolyticus]TSJ71939.1 cytochrome-c peroxidase [Algibacter amylolyticus]